MKEKIKRIVEGKIPEELQQAFKEIQMARTPFMLEKFVAGQHRHHDSMQYCQIVLELQIKYNNIRRAVLNRRKLELDIEKWEEIAKKKKKRRKNRRSAEKAQIQANLKKISIEEQDHAMLGALREYDVLYELWEKSPKKYTREEINLVQPEYWEKRLLHQANLDLLATGRVGVGDAEALHQIGLPPVPQRNQIQSVEEKYLEMETATGKSDQRSKAVIDAEIQEKIRCANENYLKAGDVKIFIAVPSEKKMEKGIPQLETLPTPSGTQIKMYNVHGRKVADAWNDVIFTFMKDDSEWRAEGMLPTNFLFALEDDVWPAPNVLIELYERMKEANGDGSFKYDIMGAWYPKRQSVREGAPIIIGEDGKRTHLMDDDPGIHEVYTCPMGCTLYRTEIFYKIPHPWFVTTDNLTQDSFFSQLAREAGYKSYIDTRLKCRHIDRIDGTVYE